MEILNNNGEKSIFLNKETTFSTGLGWDESFKDYENEVLKKVINTTQNYETLRFSHAEYDYNGLKQSDIWYNFNFLDDNKTYDSGLNYENIGLTSNQNSVLSKQTVNSFFRLEFYKTENNEKPNRANRKLMFTKNLNIALGEMVFYKKINSLIRIPVFRGTPIKNSENMFLFWFLDEKILDDSKYYGSNFYLAAKFYNGSDGTIIDFLNKPKNISDEIDETEDMYYTLFFDKISKTYQIFDVYGRVGLTETPINFYEKIK